MKRFYRCKICGSEFCLKGRKYCEEMENGGEMLCSGQPPGSHKKISMTFVGDTYKDLLASRKSQLEQENV